MSAAERHGETSDGESVHGDESSGLLAAAVAGDPRAVDRLLADIHPLVLRYCRARLGRHETLLGSADDVAQEVCMAVVHALPSYRLRGLSFRAFVYGIAAHKITDTFRATGRNRIEPVADLPDAPLTDGGPEEVVLSAELSRRVTELLGVLTPRQREVLILRVQVGLTAEETAAALGSTAGAVRVTQHRALGRLRRMIESAGPGRTPAVDTDRPGRQVAPETGHWGPMFGLEGPDGPGEQAESA